MSQLQEEGVAQCEISHNRKDVGRMAMADVLCAVKVSLQWCSPYLSITVLPTLHLHVGDGLVCRQPFPLYHCHLDGACRPRLWHWLFWLVFDSLQETLSACADCGCQQPSWTTAPLVLPTSPPALRKLVKLCILSCRVTRVIEYHGLSR